MQLLLSFSKAIASKQASFFFAGTCQPFEKIMKSALAKTVAQLINSDIFHHVAFVKNNCTIIRQQAGTFTPYRKVCKEKGMIHHENISVGDGSPCLIIVTALVILATSAHAVATITLHKIPNHTVWFKLHIRSAAILGIKGPPTDVIKLFVKFIRLNECGRFYLGDPQSTQADVITPPFDQYHF